MILFGSVRRGYSSKLFRRVCIKSSRISEARLSLDALNGVVDDNATGLDVLMVNAVDGRDEETRLDPLLWRIRQRGEDSGFILKVVIEDGSRAATGIKRHGRAVETCCARISHFQEQRGSLGGWTVECGEDSVVGKEHFGRAWV